MLDADGARSRFEGRMPGRAVLDLARAVAPRLALALAYLTLLACFGLSGPVHWLLAAVFVASAAVRPRVRSVLHDALPFALFGAAYDLLGVARRFVVSQGVEVWRPYWFDLTVFGVGSGLHRLTLNEMFARHHWPAVDLLTGLAYFSYIYAVLGFAITSRSSTARPPARGERGRSAGPSWA